MIGELDELRERIAGLPEEEQPAALFALDAIADELEDRGDELNGDEPTRSLRVV